MLYQQTGSSLQFCDFLFSCAAQIVRYSTGSENLALQDPEGRYVKQWVPEVAKLPKKYLHQPWLAPAEAQKSAGLVLGETYPHRITGGTAMQARPYSGRAPQQKIVHFLMLLQVL